MNKALSGEGLTPDRLAATASRIARAREALEVFTGRAFDTSLKFQETDRIVFSFSALVAEPEDIRLRVLRRALALVAPPEADGYGPRLERVEALAARLFAPGGCAGATLGGAVCRSRPGRDELSVARERK
jgi:tRNA(Ile)-lysidine synthase